MTVSETVANYLQTNYILQQHHGYSLYDLEYMLPWQREIYLILIAQYLEKVELERQKQANR